MDTRDEDTPQNTARPRGSGGDLQSKALSISDAEAVDAPQQPEDEEQPEASDQTTTADS
jgi:hypothetical protein